MPGHMFFHFQETPLPQFQSLIVSSRNDQQLASLLERKLQLDPSFIESALRRAIVSRKVDLLKHALEVNRLIPHDSSMRVSDTFLLQQIHRAVSLKEIEMLQCLLSYFSNPRCASIRNELQNIAILAAQVDFLDAVELLCIKFPICLEQTFQGHSILLALAPHTCQHSIDLLSDLLKQGVDVNVQEPSGDTALHVATREDNVQVMKLLLHHNACIYLSNSQGMTPLDLVQESSLHLFAQKQSPQPYQVSLYQAAKERNIEQVQQLLNSGVPIDSKWVNGHTALCSAAMNGDVELVHLLLSHGISTFPFGNTWPELPVVHALKCNHAEIAYLLMEKTEDDYNLRTKKEREHIHQQLISLLHYCSKINAVSVATLILHSKYNLDLDCSFLMSLSPIHEACRSGQLEMVKLLLLYGVDPNIKSNFYLNTPLHYACFYGHTHIASHLLKYPEVDIDCENKLHETPLYCVLHGQLTAEEKGNTREISVIFLIMHGARLLKPGRKNCELSQFDLNYAMQRWDFIPFQTQKLIIVVRNEIRPHSLANAARFCIRGALQVPISDDVLDDLGLPYRMRNYVLLKDWFPTN